MKKILFFGLILSVLVSCADESSKKQTQSVENEKETFTFSKKTLAITDFETCKNSQCPEIEVRYLIAGGSKKVAKKINQQIESHHANLLGNIKEKPAPDSLRIALENFILEYQEFKKDYPKSVGNYVVTIQDSVARNSNEVLVLKTNYYIFTGGAHGYGATNFLSFNTETGKLLSPNDIFSDLEGFKAFAENVFREKYEIPQNENINATGFFFEDNNFSLPHNLAVLKNDVVLIYNPYEAASYAQGQLELRIPKKEVQQWLKLQ